MSFRKGQRVVAKLGAYSAWITIRAGAWATVVKDKTFWSNSKEPVSTPSLTICRRIGLFTELAGLRS